MDGCWLKLHGFAALATSALPLGFGRSLILVFPFAEVFLLFEVGATSRCRRARKTSGWINPCPNLACSCDKNCLLSLTRFCWA